jgi:TPR repeat protein
MGSYHSRPAKHNTSAADISDVEDCFRLGMNYSTGHEAPLDMVSAHKWFNIAAARGHQDAIRLRREIAHQMTETEIAMAQRAARNWVTRH